MGKLEKDLLLAQDTELASILGGLSTNKSVEVRRLVANNPHTTTDVLRWMTEDSDKLVRETALSRLEIIKIENPPKAFIRQCSGCNSEVSSEANFCRSCGAPNSGSGPKCYGCQIEFENDSIFCKFCGDRLIR